MPHFLGDTEMTDKPNYIHRLPDDVWQWFKSLKEHEADMLSHAPLVSTLEKYAYRDNARLRRDIEAFATTFTRHLGMENDVSNAVDIAISPFTFPKYDAFLDDQGYLEDLAQSIGKHIVKAYERAREQEYA